MELLLKNTLAALLLTAAGTAYAQDAAETETPAESNVLFYSDFATQPAAFGEKYGAITANTDIFNGKTNQAIDYDGMIIGCGASKMRVVALSGANNSDDLTKDYGPASEDDRGASDRAIQFVTAAAGGFVLTPEVDGPATATVFVGNGSGGSSVTVLLETLVDGEVVNTAQVKMTAKRVYRLSTDYTAEGKVQFRFNANGKKQVNLNDFLVTRYEAPDPELPLELTSDNLVNEDMSYADGSLTLKFNQEVVLAGQPSIEGLTQHEEFEVSASGNQVVISYEALNINTEYTVTFPDGAVTNAAGNQSWSGAVKMATCDFGAAKVEGDNHYGKAIRKLPVSFKPFNAVAPFETEGDLVQEKQADYPHWIQVSGAVDEDAAIMTKNSDKVMAYFGPQSKQMYVNVDGTGTFTLKLQEARNADASTGWRTIRVLHAEDMPFISDVELNPETRFVKIVPTSIDGTVTLNDLKISTIDGRYDNTSGVENVAAEGGATAVVYTIDGICLGTFATIEDADLPAGLYIVKSAGKVEKVAF